MLRTGAILALMLAAAAPAPAQDVTTYGDCSPVIRHVAGDVSVICYRGEDRKPKFRVVYYRLGGIGQSFLINGKLSPDWEDYLGGQQAIVRNPVHKELRTLTDRFGQVISGSYLSGSIGPTETIGMNLADYAREVQPGIATMQTDAGEMPRFDPDSGWRVFGPGSLFVPDLDAAESLFIEGRFPADYNVYWGTASRPAEWIEPGKVLSAPTLWRSLTLADLDDYEARYDAYLGRALDIGRDATTPAEAAERARSGRFANSGAAYEPGRPIAPIAHTSLEALRYLSRNGLPENFALIEGGLGAHYGWAFTAVTRGADLVIAVLENIGEVPMDVGAFSIAATGDMTIRSHDETQALLQAAATRDMRLWPPGALAPGEKLVIPVRIEMPLMPEYHDWYVEALRDNFAPGEALRDEAVSGPSRPITFVHPDDRQHVLFVAPSGDMPEGRIPELVQRFEYGPAWSIRSVEIDGASYDFRQHDPNDFMLFAGGGIGSCPYIYTYQPEGRVWVEETHVLLGATAPELKRTDRVELHNFHGRIEIREKEHEIAHIDRMSLILRDEQGVETEYPATAPVELTEEDGVELLLGFGQASEVTFDVPRDAIAGTTAYVSTTGYYIPFSDPLLFAGNN